MSTVLIALLSALSISAFNFFPCAVCPEYALHWVCTGSRLRLLGCTGIAWCGLGAYRAVWRVVFRVKDLEIVTKSHVYGIALVLRFCPLHSHGRKRVTVEIDTNHP